MRPEKKGLLWLLGGLIGLFLFIRFYEQAFPVASVNLKLDRDQAAEQAADFLQEQGFSLEGYFRTVYFDSHEQASIYLQKTQGIERSNELIREGVPVWYWRVRWFRELEKEGFIVDIDPATGEIIDFSYSILEEAPGERLTFDQARQLAANFVREMGVDLNEFALKDRNETERPNRTDYSFVWEHRDFSVGEATLRVSVEIYGSRPGYFSRYLKVPETFGRSIQAELSLGQMLSIISLVLMFMLVISAVTILFIQYKKDRINWKFGLISGLLVGLLSVVSFFNNIPLLWAGYPDTMSRGVYLGIAAGTAMISALLVGLIIFLFGSSGESLARETAVTGTPLFDALRVQQLSPVRAMRYILPGYALGFMFLGYITVFYLAGRRFFPIWMPPEVQYSNILTTAMPFLFPLTVALTAALSEEYMFRLFAIPLIKKWFRFTWLALLLPAVIWAFGHSTYPVFPAYIRGIELTLAGLVFGAVFLKYGVETVIVAHFVINASLAGLPLLRADNLYYRGSGLIVLGLALLPLLLSRFLKAGTESRLGEDREVS